ncbi:rod shape-determining protein MreD [Pseudoroseicyclus tamaricis]|uniref:Rod shape-determining protein MreD n=1 Tax=Pseudoroseicyclus tamaricis TaxID=2705421 RepID=A0A6B2JKZ5_9RHOB|nr:rod shape-determining protein MreD [Pseudoroseicyclus tamaricis]NDV02201.1 rod shape-determining protein MreD [Pseudoroseicyclus tamaricis]
MVSTPVGRLWAGRALFLALALALIFVRLLPLNTLPKSWAPPDLLLAFTLLWAARRPDLLPAPLVALVFFTADIVFQRPPGLWALVVLLLTEWLRRRAGALRSASFGQEWLTVSAGLLGAAVAYRTCLALFMAPLAPLSLTASEMLLTALIYPLAALVAHWLFGVTRPAPGQVDSLGHRI